MPLPRVFPRSRSLLASLALGLGCQRESTPELIRVLDLVPREVEAGDRIEIVGASFPEGKNARLTFRGELHRPGEKGAHAEIVAAGEASSATQIELTLTQALEEQLCGGADHAVHTTFTGEVEVAFPAAAAGAPPVASTLRNVTLDVRPPTPRRAVLDARAKEGRNALAFLGITVGRDPAAAGGLRIDALEKGSRGDEAGLMNGDVITSVDHVRIVSIGDAIPAETRGNAVFTVRRGSATQELTREVKVDGLRMSPPADLIGAGVVLALAAIVLLLFMAPTAGIITWVERRVSARMQSRVGPNRAGPQGFFVWIADGIKSLLKEDVIPKASDNPLFRMAPYLVFAGVSATFVVMPFGQYLIAADLDVGILYVVAATSLVTIGLLCGGWASNNKYSLLGGVRSAAQIVSYEVPGAIAIACIVVMTGSLKMQEIVRAQGGWPWEWFIFKNPVTLALFCVYFTTTLAEGNRAPFDLPEAESELVAGYATEYSGMRYLFFFFAEWANVFVMCGIAAALFLGGWQLPGVAAGAQEAKLVLQLAGAALFLTKAWLLVFVVIWIRWTLPRVRVDQMTAISWKWLVPISLVAFVACAGWVAWAPAARVQLWIGVGMFAMFCLLLVRFAQRVRFNLRASTVDVHLNPFL